MELGIQSATAMAEGHASRHLGGGADPIALATTSVAGLMSSSDKSKLNGVSSSAINQTQGDDRYELKSNKGVVSGYSSLNSSGLVTVTELGTGTANSSSYLRGDRTWQPQSSIDAGSVGGFGQTSLEKTSNKGIASGYASLDANIRVPNSQLGSGTASTTTFLRGDRQWIKPLDVERASFFEGGVLSEKTGVGRYPMIDAGTITLARAVVNTAPTGASLNISLKKNDVQFSTITMSAGTNEAVTGTLSTAVVAGDDISVDITQVGSTVAGSNLTVIVKIEH